MVANFFFWLFIGIFLPSAGYGLVLCFTLPRQQRLKEGREERMQETYRKIAESQLKSFRNSMIHREKIRLLRAVSDIEEERKKDP